MSVAYVDSSCIVAVLLGEAGHERILAQLSACERLYASNLLEAEVRGALKREGIEATGAIFGDLDWVLPARSLSAEIAIVLEAGRLRGADLWHVASALYLSPEPGDLAFLTEDVQQAEVARRLGFMMAPSAP